MNKYFIVLALIAGIGCGKSDSKEESAREWNKKTGIQMCEKMVECSRKMLEQMPAAHRKMVEAKMPNKDTCLAEQEKKGAMDEKVTMTEEEIAAAKQCMTDMANATCEQIQGMKIPNCLSFSAMMAKKGKIK